MSDSPGRGQRTEAPARDACAIVLAAGASRRLGRPKQLVELGGRPALQHVLDAAAGAGLEPILLVLGHMAEEIAGAVCLPAGARVVVNPDHASGQASSLRAGLAGAPPEAGAAVILLGDQPGVGAGAILAVVETWRREGAAIVRACYSGSPGHPVLLARAVWEEVMAATGDRGARDAIAADPSRVGEAQIAGVPPADIDTEEDVARLAAEWSSTHRPPGASRMRRPVQAVGERADLLPRRDGEVERGPALGGGRVGLLALRQWTGAL